MRLTKENDAVIAKVADALMLLEELDQTLVTKHDINQADSSRFGARIDELRTRALRLLKVLTRVPSRGRGH